MGRVDDANETTLAAATAAIITARWTASGPATQPAPVSNGNGHAAWAPPVQSEEPAAHSNGHTTYGVANGNGSGHHVHDSTRLGAAAATFFAAANPDPVPEVFSVEAPPAPPTIPIQRGGEALGSVMGDMPFPEPFVAEPYESFNAFAPALPADEVTGTRVPPGFERRTFNAPVPGEPPPVDDSGFRTPSAAPEPPRGFSRFTEPASVPPPFPQEGFGGPFTRQSFASEFPPEMPSEFAPEMPAAFAPELPSGFAPEMPPGFAPEVPSGFAPETPSGFAPPETRPDFGPSGPPAFTEFAPPTSPVIGAPSFGPSPGTPPSFAPPTSGPPAPSGPLSFASGPLSFASPPPFAPPAPPEFGGPDLPSELPERGPRDSNPLDLSVRDLGLGGDVRDAVRESGPREVRAAAAAAFAPFAPPVPTPPVPTPPAGLEFPGFGADAPLAEDLPSFDPGDFTPLGAALQAEREAQRGYEAHTGERRAVGLLPRRTPSTPDVPDIALFANDPLLDPSAPPSADGFELTRIATYLRDEEERGATEPRPDGFDFADVLEAVRGVRNVRDAHLRWNSGAGHTLRIEFTDDADEGEVTRAVVRLLRQKMGLAAAPSDEEQSTLDRPFPRPRSGIVASAPVPVRGTPPPAPARPRPASQPLPRPSGVDGSGPRLVLDHVQTTTLGADTTVEVRVIVSRGGRPAESAVGTGQGPAVDAYLLRLAATSAANAIDQLVAGRARCFIEHVAVVPFGVIEVALVVLLLAHGDGHTEQLAGSAIVSGDPRQAVVRATLAALNRRLESLLA